MFWLLFPTIPVQLQDLILQRIRACHHISLAAHNRDKLQKLYALLWKLMGVTVRESAAAISAITAAAVAAANNTASGGSKKSKGGKAAAAKARAALKGQQQQAVATRLKHTRAMLDVLNKHILSMGQAMPVYAGAVAMKHMRALADGHRQSTSMEYVDVNDEDGWIWPPLEALLVLQLCGQVFPASDMVHAVLTPAVRA